MGSFRIKPEHQRRPGQAGTSHCELDPVANRLVFDSAQAPNILFFDGVAHQRLSSTVEHRDGASTWGLKSGVMRTVLFGLLRHQAHIWNRSQCRWVESPKLLAVFNHRSVNARIAAVRDDRLHVVQCVVCAPHLSRFTNSCGHGRIDDHVARHVQIGNTLIRVDHGKCRPTFQTRI